MHTMRSFKLIVAYNGTNYNGWQWQPEGKTIDRALRESFLGIFKQDTLLLVGASRTDAGVHAQGQVVRIRTTLHNITPEKLLYVWNKSLAEDILIKEIYQVNDTFHPQHNVVKKTYHYTIFTERPNPTHAHLGWHFPYPICQKTLIKTLQGFVGTHDFKKFCKEETSKNTLKTLDAINVLYNQEEKSYVLIFEGKSFLRHMIRRIVGTAVSLAALKNEPINKNVFELNLSKVLLTAPAKGLCLMKIEYDNGEKL